MRHTRAGHGTAWKDTALCAGTAAAVWILFNVVFTVHTVPSTSMEPTVEAGSAAVCWRLPFAFMNPFPKYGEIIVFYSDELQTLLVKRVAGLPGDIISFRDGAVLRNGKPVPEPYLKTQGQSACGNCESYTVPEGCVFVLGDNRTHSCDSRYFDMPFIPVYKIRSVLLFSFRLRNGDNYDS